MLNHITIMGRLTRDPELRRTSSGVAVASFTLAVDRDFSGKENEKETDFIDCVAWRQTGEFVSKYFTKGRMMVVSGRLQIRNFTDKDGNKRRAAEVVAENCYFGDSKKEDQSNGNSYGGGAPAGGNAYGGNGAYGGYGGAPGYGGVPGNPAGYGGAPGYDGAPGGYHPGGYGEAPMADMSQSYQNGFTSYGGNSNDDRFNN